MESVLDDWTRCDHTKIGQLYMEMWPHRFQGTGDYVVNLGLGYFTFTTIRNPYDRYLSGLNHAKRQPKALGAYWLHEHVIATQVETLGRLRPDYVMRLETIENDYKYLQDKFDLDDLPKLNGGCGGRLTKPMIRWVNEHFAEDFERFGYEKITT